MAGDWIKMRCDLQSHPKVVRILSATKADKFRVIGGLHAVWSVFDAHSVDGVLPGYTPDLMDHIIGWEGFSVAMIAVGWLVFDGIETLQMPDFTEHNGKSGKRRAEDQKRKRDGRKAESCPDQVQQNADKMRTCCGLEKRREEKNKKHQSSPDHAGAQVVKLQQADRFQMFKDWWPSADFQDQLAFTPLPTDIDWKSQVTEFVFYRMEHGESLTQAGWDHKFLQCLIANQKRREEKLQ